jgi:hypothetical protein
MIDICALGPLRVSSGLFNAGLLKSGAKVSFYYFHVFSKYLYKSSFVLCIFYCKKKLYLVLHVSLLQ